MNSPAHSGRKSGLARFIDGFEETAIAVILGLMTLITFANVIVRYVFNSAPGHWVANALGIALPTEILWGLEVTLVLFAWLVLFGISYGFKVTTHLGVDAVLNMVQPGTRRVLVLISVAACLIYAALLMKGAWDYWAPFAGLDATTGRWFPTGFNAGTRDQGWYETEQIPMLNWLRWIQPIFNGGDAYEKLPRFIPYAILPIGAALLLLRLIQAAMRIVRGEQSDLIVSHEAEDEIEEIASHQGES